MNARVSSHLILSGLFLSALLGECKTSRMQTTSAGARSAHHILLAELQRQATSSYYPFRLDTANVIYEKRASAVVPELVYEWALFKAPRISHAWVFGVVATLHEQSALITSSSDWATLLRSWSPASRDIAMNTCLEIVQVTRDVGPYHPAALFEGHGLSRPDLMPADSAALVKYAAPPRVKLPEAGDDTWSVDAWIVNPSTERIATRYECTISTDTRGTRSISVVAVDSLLRVGLH